MSGPRPRHRGPRTRCRGPRLAQGLCQRGSEHRRQRSSHQRQGPRCRGRCFYGIDIEDEFLDVNEVLGVTASSSTSRTLSSIEDFVFGVEDLVWLKDIDDEVLDVEDLVRDVEVVVLDVFDLVLDIETPSSTLRTSPAMSGPRPRHRCLRRGPRHRERGRRCRGPRPRCQGFVLDSENFGFGRGPHPPCR
jgi:hypothetical protein